MPTHIGPSKLRSSNASKTRSKSPHHAALEAARRGVRKARLGLLAQKLPLPYERSELVVPPDVAAELDFAVAWASGQKKVLGDRGFRRHAPLSRGLTVLFAGPRAGLRTIWRRDQERSAGCGVSRRSRRQADRHAPPDCGDSPGACEGRAHCECSFELVAGSPPLNTPRRSPYGSRRRVRPYRSSSAERPSSA